MEAPRRVIFDNDRAFDASDSQRLHADEALSSGSNDEQNQQHGEAMRIDVRT